MFYLSRTQCESGHDVHLVLPLVPKMEVIPDVSVHRVVPFEIQPIVGTSGFARFQQLLKLLLFLVATSIIVPRLHRMYEFDLIHVHGGYPMTVLAAFLRTRVRKPTILTVHSSLKPSRWFGLFDGKINPMKRIDRIIATSYEIAHEINQLGVCPENIFTISSGVDSNLFRQCAGTNSSKHEILFIGRLRPVKGVRYLLRAMKRIREEAPRAHLTIVGNGQSLPALRSMVQELNLLDAVTFELDVPHSEVVRFLRKAALLVMPSIASKEEIGEGRPTAIMEALYAGVPVVASRIGGIPELVKDGINGFLVESGKVDELANRILRLLLEPDTRLRFSEKALRIRDEVGWKQISERVDGVYGPVLAKSS